MKDKHAPQIKGMQSIRATGGSGVPTDSSPHIHSSPCIDAAPDADAEGLAAVYALILECREKTSIGVTDGHEDGEA